MIEGEITKPSAAKHVPEGTLRRRFFSLETGEEIDSKQGQFRVGDRLVVVIEAASGATDAALADAPEQDLSPLLVADLLPSSFQLVSGNVFGQKELSLQGALRALKSVGDLRSVESDPDRWLALIVPESRHRRELPEQPDATPPEVEFRQGYVVQLNMAGNFTFPATTIEPTSVPIETLHAEPSNIEIRQR